MLEALTRSLEVSEPLSPDDRAALARLGHRTREVRAGTDLQDESSCTLVLAGLLCSYSLLPEGRREILAFHIPGDACDLQELGLSTGARLCALTPAQVAFVSRADLAAVLDAHPDVARAIWRRTLADGLVSRQWMISLGVRGAYARTAHLFCELLARYEGARLAKDDGFELGVSQADLADALGLSVVHINRVLQRLRAEGLIEWRTKRLRVLDRERLESAADFDPAYLKATAPSLGPSAGLPAIRFNDGAGLASSVRLGGRPYDGDQQSGRLTP